MTLVEVLIALTILVLTSFGGIGAFTLLNRYAATTRNACSAKALCQERIEQVMALPFHPPLTVPSVPGAITGNGPFNILGTGANWSSDTPPYINGSNVTYAATSGTNGLQTSTEPVTICLQQDGATATVTGTRTTTVKSIVTALTPATGAINVPTVLFTVNVAYTDRNTTKTYSMSTLRAFD